METMTIRYASDTSTPATYGIRGCAVDLPTAQRLDSHYWAVTGTHDALIELVRRAVFSSDLYSFTLGGAA